MSTHPLRGGGIAKRGGGLHQSPPGFTVGLPVKYEAGSPSNSPTIRMLFSGFGFFTFVPPPLSLRKRDIP